ncbi:hypothetical protein PYW08_004827 [Mythimna loreyi]|uniref:Uncharacterized protein n=1 Tax=Mythimna loreyi TaxID=667449 RepID=A0ACC2QFA5_9NEOP|nr:hypothetical protein PYW08_004827 [Mythimna loreyi]
MTFVNIERPKITYFDPKYFNKVFALSRRLNRQDPRHYLEVYVDTRIQMDNTMKLEFFVYQFLTNRYKPSFIELHYQLCDLINLDPLIGKVVLNALGGRTCPYPPGVYDLKNLSVPFVPKGFPFTKGRIYINVSLTDSGEIKNIGRAYIDMEFKVANIRHKTN